MFSSLFWPLLLWVIYINWLSSFMILCDSPNATATTSNSSLSPTLQGGSSNGTLISTTNDPINSPCNSTEQCRAKHGLESICVNSACHCAIGYVPSYNGSTCERIRCTNTMDCLQGLDRNVMHHLDCYPESETCGCHPGYHEVKDRLTCVPDASTWIVMVIFVIAAIVMALGCVLIACVCGCFCCKQAYDTIEDHRRKSALKASQSAVSSGSPKDVASRTAATVHPGATKQFATAKRQSKEGARKSKH